MGRPRGSKNKPKGPAASGESTYPSNGGEHVHIEELSEDARCALLVNHVTYIERVDAQIKTLDDQRKKLRTQAKNEGFELKAEIDHALEIRKKMREGKIGEWLEAERKKARVERWFNLKIEPTDMFDHQAATNETAYYDGKLAAAEGIGKCIPPSHLRNDGPDSPAQKWIAGWHDMQEAMVRHGIKPPEPPPEPNGQGHDDTDLRPDILKQREADGVYNQPPGDAIDQLIAQPDGQRPADAQ